MLSYRRESSSPKTYNVTVMLKNYTALCKMVVLYCVFADDF